MEEVMKRLFAKRQSLLAVAMGLALTVIVTGAVLAQPSKDEPTLVSVEGGKVRGTSEKDLIVFKGIPFAQPPVGALRWRLPKPP
jgi:para-nitrobenzyl esterase